MKLITSFKSISWRPVAGLVLAGLLGWIAAWLMLPSGGAPAPGASGKADPALTHRQATPTLPDSSAPGRPEASPSSPTLEQLLQRQEAISQGAARSATIQPQPGSTGSTGAAPSVPAKPTPSDTLAEKMKAMQVLQATALADIQAVPPGDTKKMIAAMERFDAQMRAAGAPAIIDMDNLRKMLEASDRIQSLNRQMLAEAEKGRTADASKLKALSQEMQSVQQAMPRQVIKTDVVQKLMAK